MPDVTPLRTGDPGRVGRYRLTARLTSTGASSETRRTTSGEAGEGTPGQAGRRTYLASAPDSGEVALTLLGTDRISGPAARDRFADEARTARRVAPFCAARILDAGFHGDEPYLVSEFVPGPSLRECVAGEGPLAVEDLQALAIGSVTGLAAIHRAGLVHGHPGPDHLLLSPDGPCMVHAGLTPDGGDATPAADMLAWAHTVLFAALGRPPAGPQDLAALPASVKAVVAPCLDPVPAGRPDARAALTQLIGGRDLPAGLLAEGNARARALARVPPPDAVLPDPPARHGARSRAPWVVAGAAGLLVAGGIGAYLASPGGRRGPVPGHGGPATTATVPRALAGTWSGAVSQTHPSLTATVRISFAATARTGTVSYPRLGCSGRLALLSRSGERLTVTQTITAGRARCEDGVITLALQPGGGLTFVFRRSGGASPAGTLTRHGQGGPHAGTASAGSG